MRFFAFTLIAYLLLLSWQPCQDLAVNKPFLSTWKTEQIAQSEPPENESDDCSPFCVCSCCQISTVANFPAFSVKNVYTVSISRDTKTFYQNNYSKHHLNNIWQPPKFNFTA